MTQQTLTWKQSITEDNYPEGQDLIFCNCKEPEIDKSFDVNHVHAVAFFSL